MAYIPLLDSAVGKEFNAMVNGHKRVRIDIHFTGVGLVDLATIKEMLAIAESSRP